MAPKLSTSMLALVAITTLMLCGQQLVTLVKASDPDPLQDFCIADLARGATVNGFPCMPAANASSDDFSFSNLGVQANTSTNLFNGVVTAGNVLAWPALNTLGLALARLDIAPGGVIVPHTHNLATEILFVLEGEIYTGFVTNDQKLFAKTVKKGEAFIFPRGLLHFQLNRGTKHAASLNVLNGQKPGVQLMPLALFGSGIPTDVLSKSFLLGSEQVEAITATFTQ